MNHKFSKFLNAYDSYVIKYVKIPELVNIWSDSMSIKRHVPITFYGKTYFIEVSIDGDENSSTSIIEVEYGGNVKSTQKGFLPVEEVASFLLKDLIRQRKNMVRI